MPLTTAFPSNIGPQPRFVPVNIIPEMLTARNNPPSIISPVKSRTEKSNVTVPNKFLSPGLSSAIRNNGNQSINVEKSAAGRGSVKMHPKKQQQTVPPPPLTLAQEMDRKKLFMCADCNNAFSRLHLFKHMKDVHNKYSCLYCYGFFENVEKLEKHLMRRHKVENVQFNDELALHKYLDSSLSINSTDEISDLSIINNNATSNLSSGSTSAVESQSPSKNRRAFKAVCCHCGVLMDFDKNNLTKHVCDGLKNANSSNISDNNKNLSDSRAEELMEMDLEDMEIETPERGGGVYKYLNNYNLPVNSSKNTTKDLIQPPAAISFNDVAPAVNQTPPIESPRKELVPPLKITITKLKANVDVNSAPDFNLMNKIDDPELDFLKHGPGSLGFNGSVLKHMQNSVDNYLQQQQKTQTSSQTENCPNDDDWRVESEPAAEDQLIVPKLKVKIPKFFDFKKIESEEESCDDQSDQEIQSEKGYEEDLENGDSDDESGESMDEIEDEEITKRKNELMEKMREIQNKLAKKQNKISKKETIHESETTVQIPTITPIPKPVVVETAPPPAPITPSIGLKIKFKNIQSENIEAVVENAPEKIDSDEEEDDEDSFEQPEIEPQPEEHEVVPMDIEPPFEATPQIPIETPEVETPQHEEQPEIIQEPEPEPPQKPRTIPVDNMELIPANEEAMEFQITLKEPLETIQMREFMKLCLKNTFGSCLYCNHARKIVVNGKSLAIHFITTHRFNVNIEDGVELENDKILDKFESGLTELDECYFNLETFDNFDPDKKEGHITISHDKLYECFQCRFQTNNHKELYLHNRKMHQKSLIVCLMCKINFYSYSELLCHICPGRPHKQQFLDYKFYCCLCNTDNIPSAFRLMVHLRKKHYACDVCLEKCNDQSKLSGHVWKHKLNHLCYKCGIYYRNKADIMKHLFWKHGTEGITCKKCLQKKWPHVYHFCTPPNAFTCEICNSEFSKAINLKVHRRLHENEEKYPCTEEPCEKKFISKKLLLKHVARHKLTLGEIGGSPNKSNVVIPEEIPENQCSRTIPIQFRDIKKKILPLPIEKPKELTAPETLEAPDDETLDNAKTKSKDKKKKKHKEKAENADKEKPAEENSTENIPEIPEMKVNLSESDSSDNEDESFVKKPAMEWEDNSNSKPMPQPLVECSRLSDSSDDEGNKPDQTTKPTEEISKKPEIQARLPDSVFETFKKIYGAIEEEFARKEEFSFDDLVNLEESRKLWEEFVKPENCENQESFKSVLENFDAFITKSKEICTDTAANLNLSFEEPEEESKNPVESTMEVDGNSNLEKKEDAAKEVEKSVFQSKNDDIARNFGISLKVLAFVENPESSELSKSIFDLLKNEKQQDLIEIHQNFVKILKKSNSEQILKVLEANLQGKNLDTISKVLDSHDDTKNLEPIKNIWENFKNFQESQQQKPKKPLVPEDSRVLADSEDELAYGKEMIGKEVTHVVQSDHDYAKMWKSYEDVEKEKEAERIKVENEKAAAEAAKLNSKVSPKKKKRHDSSSSSDSDSDSSSSSCSCGSKCSCSSSSSSSSSSSDSDSSSDSADNAKPAKDKETPKKKKKHQNKPEDQFPTKSNDAIDVMANFAPPKDPDEMIYESDLETDETDTDEDFYDEHPQKFANQMLAEKRRQLLLQSNGDFDGFIENSRPSTPSLPPEETSVKKRLKIKKRKKDRKSSMSPTKKPSSDQQRFMEASFAMSTKAPELHEASEIRQLLQSQYHTQPVLPIIKEMQEQKRLSVDAPTTPQLSIKAPSSAASSRKNSESGEMAIKRSQRKRIPNKFYGYTSDDESSVSANLTGGGFNSSFKPTLPPQLTWRKEDLPSSSKKDKSMQKKDNVSFISKPSKNTNSKSYNMNMSLLPYKPPLTLTHMQQLPPQLNNQEYIQQYLQDQNYPVPTVIEPLKVPHNVPVQHVQQPITYQPEVNPTSDSSDEEPALQISERKRKPKPINRNSIGMTDPHNPPPIPKLKLTIGNDNKIKRRNIKPGGPPAKKKKVTASSRTAKKKINSTMNDLSMYSQGSLFNESFDSSSTISLSQSLSIPSTSLMPPSQLLKSPIMESNSANINNDFFYSQPASMSMKQIEQKEKIAKQQKLEDAIQKTQQYYQQFHQQQIKPNIQQQAEVKEGERLYCYCRAPYDEASEMIGCDGDSCQIEWFHFECVCILVAPKGKWYCPECQKTQQQQSIGYPAV